MSRVLLAQYSQRIFVPILLDVAVGCQILCFRRPLDKIGSGDYGQGAGVVGRIEVGLRQCERIIVRVCNSLAFELTMSRVHILVNASTLSPTKIAVSYWCFSKADVRQLRRYDSMP